MIKYSLIVLFTQFVFVFCRTWNIKAISRNNIIQTIASGLIIHVCWLVSIAIGANFMHKIMEDFQFEYLPVIISSCIGGVAGTIIAMKKK